MEGRFWWDSCAGGGRWLAIMVKEVPFFAKWRRAGDEKGEGGGYRCCFEKRRLGLHDDCSL